MAEGALLNHVALQCNDKEKAETFFTEVLELPIKKKFTVSRELSEAIFGIDESVDVEVYDNNETRFEIFITQTEEKRGYGHVCIEIDNKKEFIDRCKQYGIKPMFITKGGKNLLFVRDFSGNLFEIKEK
ncbi:MAG: VOC family protein [Thermoplasmatales archaeon]|nr:VOC family protein [Thermoplasmatales archaeon]